MDLHALESLVAIDDHGSFVAAARARSLSVPRVSLQISALEAELGCQLFDRSRRPARLTDAGARLVHDARALILQWQRLRESNARGRLLRLGAVHSSVASRIAPALRALRISHPAMRVQLHTGLSHELESALLAAQLDCAVISEPEASPPPGTQLIRIAREPLWVLAHRDAPGANDDAQVLMANPYLRFAREARVARLIERTLVARSIQIESTMEVGTLDAINALVRAQLGVSIVPAQAPQRDPTLRAIAFGKPQVSREIALLIRTDVVARDEFEPLVSALMGV